MRLRRQGGGLHLDGARDGDIPADRTPEAANLDLVDRDLTARVLGEANADVVALQEVFDQASLDHFHDHVMAPAGVTAYPYRYCLPGNDGRGLDIALMSRLKPVRIESHAGETPSSLGLEPVAGCKANDRVFRRDCLEVDLGPLTLFVSHFKAPYPDLDAAQPIRRLEAAAVAKLIERRFRQPDTAFWLVAGDLNEPGPAERTAGSALEPIMALGGVDLMLRISAEERWSFHQPYSEIYSRPDALIASRALAEEHPDAVPGIIRSGLDFDADRYSGKRLAGVGQHRPHASDHAAVVVDFPGLEGGPAAGPGASKPSKT